MSFFVAPSESALDLMTNTMATRPEFADRYDAIQELREIDRTGLSLGATEAARANGFFRVASLQAPLETIAHVLNPDWMKDPKQFYAWLDKHPKHCTYDRRRNPRPNQLTFSDGQVVL
jgi:hypothetical protein